MLRLFFILLISLSSLFLSAQNQPAAAAPAADFIRSI